MPSPAFSAGALPLQYGRRWIGSMRARLNHFQPAIRHRGLALRCRKVFYFPGSAGIYVHQPASIHSEARDNVAFADSQVELDNAAAKEVVLTAVAIFSEIRRPAEPPDFGHSIAIHGTYTTLARDSPILTTGATLLGKHLLELIDALE